MDKCLVYGCPSNVTTNDSSIQFYQFPKHPVIAQQWLNSCCVWNSNEVDLNTAKICSVHFDTASYTSEYKMVDYVGYTRVLKYDAVPTLYLPQQTIIYRIADVQDDNFSNPSYEPTSVIIENNQYEQHGDIADDSCTSKYEELQAVPLQSDNCSVKVEENSLIDQKYKVVASYRDLEDIKTENEVMKKELLKLEQSVDGLRKKLSYKIDEYKKNDMECNKLRKTLRNFEMKSMSLSEQKNLLSKVFSESQIKILSGKKKIYWSHDDMAIAYTIRHMSSKRCYIYLAKKLNIPLPGLSSIRRWQSLKKGELMKEETAGKDKTEDSDQ